MIGNVSTNAITPVIVPERLKVNYSRDVAPVTNLIDIPGYLVVTTTNFNVKSVPELIEYAKKNPGKLRYGTVGAGSYPHYDMAFFAKRAGDLNMVAIHNKAGASGVINDMVTGDVQVAFLNVGLDRRADQGRQAPADRDRQPRAAGGLSGRADHEGGGLPRRRHDRVERDVRAGSDAAGRCWSRCTRPPSRRCRSPAAKDGLSKQNFNIVPSKSLDDAGPGSRRRSRPGKRSPKR